MKAWSRAEANRFRWDGTESGHYESYFIRANHPREPRAFWIRYTVFVRAGDLDAARGELWFIAFDGVKGEHRAAKSVHPMTESRFGLGPHGLDILVGSASLTDDLATGTIDDGAVSWDLRLSSSDTNDAPLLLLKEALYAGGFPKAKTLTPRPFTSFTGTLVVDGEPIAIENWLGSQNHNWGSRHTDRYSWGQVVGFEGAPDVFLECATARLRFGSVWTPPLTTLVLVEGRERTLLTGLRNLVRGSGVTTDLAWRVSAKGAGVSVHATFTAPSKDFVGLSYDNPPGGAKICLNSKIARCELVVDRGGRQKRLVSDRAAFEILTDDAHPSIPTRI